MDEQQIFREMYDWAGQYGPLHCPRCGAIAQFELTDASSRPREMLSCGCGEQLEYVHPPVGELLPLGGWGAQWARNLALTPWRATPRGLRRWPRLARLLAPSPLRVVKSWTWDEATWPTPTCED